MSKVKDFKRYQDRHGLVQHLPGQTSGNGLMYTAEAELILSSLQSESNELAMALKLRYAMQACHKWFGTFYRTPDEAFGHQSFDDLYGVAVISNTWAYEILKKLKYSKGFYKTTENPNKKWTWKWFYFWGQIWLYRQPQFIAHLKACAGVDLNWFDRFAWKTSLWLAGDKTDHDGWRKGYLMVMGYWKHCRCYRDLQSTCDRWSKALQKRYPNGIGECRAEYFQNENHPNAVYSKGFFGYESDLLGEEEAEEVQEKD